jgi:hypothetical protein
MDSVVVTAITDGVEALNTQLGTIIAAALVIGLTLFGVRKGWKALNAGSGR